MKIKFIKKINNGAIDIEIGSVVSVIDTEGTEQIKLGNAVEVDEYAMCMMNGDEYVGCLSPDQMGVRKAETGTKDNDATTHNKVKSA